MLQELNLEPQDDHLIAAQFVAVLNNAKIPTLPTLLLFLTVLVLIFEKGRIYCLHRFLYRHLKISNG